MGERGPELYLSILREATASGEPRTLSEVFADRLDALLAQRARAAGAEQHLCTHCGYVMISQEVATIVNAEADRMAKRIHELEARIERLTAQRDEKDAVIRDHRAEVERLTATAMPTTAVEQARMRADLEAARVLREFVEEIAGGDCYQYDKHLNPVPCGACRSCRARALLTPTETRRPTT